MGVYTEIVEIIAPSEAAYGDLVTVEVRVKKLYEDWLPIAVGGWLEYGVTPIWFEPEYKWFEPGDTEPFPFTYSFTMPNKAVDIHVWSYYGPNGDFIDDDYGYAYIALAGVPEPYAGTISRMELEYDEARANIPAYDIPQGERGLVHIWGRNDMDEAQRMGISWVVKDPDGVVVEEYSTWELWPYTGAGKEHEFIGDRFNLDKAGTYTITVGLLMNPDDPVYVHTYYGDLCTVAAEVPEPYAGTISKKQLEYDESRASIPAYNVPQGERGLVHIWGRNDMDEAQRMGISWVVKDPDGVVVEEYSDWEAWPYTGAGKEHEFIGDRFNLNKTGGYRLEVSLMMNPDNPVVVDTYSGILCTVAALVFAGTISRVVLEYDQAEGAIPVSDIPLGQRGLVHVYGRNDTAERQQLSIHWIVKDPDGLVVEDYSDVELGTTGPGDEHHFIGDRFDLNKEGAYTISVDLFMGESAIAVAAYGTELFAGVR